MAIGKSTPRAAHRIAFVAIIAMTLAIFAMSVSAQTTVTITPSCGTFSDNFNRADSPTVGRGG